MARKINAEWHNANRMPRNPTHEQRMQWHLGHSQNCNCRQMTPKLEQEVEAWKAKHLTTPAEGAG